LTNEQKELNELLGVLNVTDVADLVEQKLTLRDVYNYIKANPGKDLWEIADGIGMTVPPLVVFLQDLVNRGQIYELNETWYPTELPREEETILGFEAELDDVTCDDCIAYHGDTFTPEEAEAEFEYLDRSSETIWYPNVHPNCRCRLVVISIVVGIEIMPEIQIM